MKATENTEFHGEKREQFGSASGEQAVAHRFHLQALHHS
jgi:hypothetical protein